MADDDQQINRDLSEQLKDLEAWNDRKDEDSSWERDVDKLQRQQPRGSKAPTATSGLGREVAGAAAGRLGLILCGVAILLALGAVVLWLKPGRHSETVALVPQPTTQAAPGATQAAPGATQAAPGTTEPPAAQAKPANEPAAATTPAPSAGKPQPAARAKPGGPQPAAGAKPGGLQPAAGAKPGGTPPATGKDGRNGGGSAPGNGAAKAGQKAAAGGPAAKSGAANNTAQTGQPAPGVTAASSQPQATAAAAHGPVVHRATHTPALMARLNALWQNGRAAKHRGDYPAARRDWTTALRLCPGHPGFRESLNALPR